MYLKQSDILMHNLEEESLNSLNIEVYKNLKELTQDLRKNLEFLKQQKILYLIGNLTNLDYKLSEEDKQELNIDAKVVYETIDIDLYNFLSQMQQFLQAYEVYQKDMICKYIDCENTNSVKLPSNVITFQENQRQFNDSFNELKLNMFLNPNLEFVNFTSYIIDYRNEFNLLNIDILLGFGKSKFIENNNQNQQQQVQNNTKSVDFINQDQNMLDVLKKSGIIDKKMFSVFLGDQYKMLDSIITLGDFNIELFDKQEYDILNCTSAQYYTVNLRSIQLQNLKKNINSTINYNKNALISIVSPFIELELQILEQIIKAISNQVNVDCFISEISHQFNILIQVVICQRMSLIQEVQEIFPVISFQLGEKLYELQPDKYISDCYLYIDNNTEFCVTFFKLINRNKTKKESVQDQNNNDKNKNQQNKSDRQNKSHTEYSQTQQKQNKNNILNNSEYLPNYIRSQINFPKSHQWIEEDVNDDVDLILGTPFIRSYYTIFDEENNQIYLGKARQLVEIFKQNNKLVECIEDIEIIKDSIKKQEQQDMKKQEVQELQQLQKEIFSKKQEIKENYFKNITDLIYNINNRPYIFDDLKLMEKIINQNLKIKQIGQIKSNQIKRLFAIQSVLENENLLLAFYKNYINLIEKENNMLNNSNELQKSNLNKYFENRRILRDEVKQKMEKLKFDYYDDILILQGKKSKLQEGSLLEKLNNPNVQKQMIKQIQECGIKVDSSQEILTFYGVFLKFQKNQNNQNNNDYSKQAIEDNLHQLDENSQIDDL
ncbi:Aspartic peptidase domain [Pseudocohnilembus persalinus]|uniref:Aspartic peptidase domain n=1 Tax=Pseudocohnilembus persalinus TaxID=266149 RepID=A0A0V0QWG6_PSEPJ|nr:Aspartic peptidase domain [Pseudocohnilembus persalinus]|eukprot:KRX06671.1 Aspartic peptidase domain [Pseudocohnilembus persalinus]